MYTCSGTTRSEKIQRQLFRAESPPHEGTTWPSPLCPKSGLLPSDFQRRGWALCNGQLLPINQNQALFSLLGTTYGGDGRVTFGLPNLQGRTPMHMGSGHTLGETGGEQTHVLTIQEIPSHVHTAQEIGRA